MREPFVASLPLRRRLSLFYHIHRQIRDQPQRRIASFCQRTSSSVYTVQVHALQVSDIQIPFSRNTNRHPPLSPCMDHLGFLQSRGRPVRFRARREYAGVPAVFRVRFCAVQNRWRIQRYLYLPASVRQSCQRELLRHQPCGMPLQSRTEFFSSWQGSCKCFQGAVPVSDRAAPLPLVSPVQSDHDAVHPAFDDRFGRTALFL